MKTLDEQQREWLDVAIRNKGRFTSRKSIEKSFQEYQRRRAKTATALEGMPNNAPLRPVVEQHLKDADDFAKEGNFSKAYTSLSKIKDQAKVVSGPRLDQVAVASLTTAIDQIEQGLNGIYAIADYTVSTFNTVVQKALKIPAVGDASDLSKAIERREAITLLEPVLTLEVNSCIANCTTAISRITQATPLQAILGVEQQITTYEQAGLGNAVAAQKKRLADLRVNCEEHGGRYHDPNVLGKVQMDSNTAIKNALINAKDFKGFQVGRTDKDKKKPPQVIDIPNDFLKQAIVNLRPLSPDEADYLEYTEQRRLVQAKTTFALNGLTDMVMSLETGLGPLRPSPEPEKFDADLVFDGALGNQQELPDDIPFSVAQDLVAFVKSKMAGVVKNLPSDSDGLIDLFLMSKEDLARMANKALTGVDSPKGISQSHDIMLKQVADEMRKAISENAPNKVSGDKSEMTIGNDKWKLVKTLGAGAGGTAMLYCKENDPSETIVVKMPNPLNEAGGPYMGDQYSKLTDEEKKAAAVRGREAMAQEMRTHHRLSKDNTGQDKSDNLLDMSGAAIGPDGELFMVMETAAGGDMAGLGLNMSVVQNLGIIPPEARSALARDLIVQTIKGMKALEQRGLIHNDLKPENVLMGEDGTLKIMDFGESRFGDDDGKTENVITAEEGDAPFRVTPGYDGDEQYKRGGKIDSRSDIFALGVVAKLFSADEYSSSDIKKDVTDKTAMGKLIAAATSKNVDDRPSLDSLLASSVLSANQEDYTEDMVADLRKAMVKFGMTMSAAKTPLDVGDIPPPKPWDERPPKPGEDPQLSEKKAKMAEEWEIKVQGEMRQILDRELNRDTDQNDPNLPSNKSYSLGELQVISKAIGNELKNRRQRVNTASVESRDLYKSQLEAAEKAILWLQTKMKEMTEATTLAGQEEFDNLCKDTNQKLTVPGEGGGEMTVGEAVKLRDERILQLKTLQQDFYQFANDHPELAAKELAETNIKLNAMKDQLQFVNDAVFKILGPKGKFMVAQKELAEATIGFGA